MPVARLTSIFLLMVLTPAGCHEVVSEDDDDLSVGDDDQADDDCVDVIDTCPYTSPPAIDLRIEQRVSYGSSADGGVWGESYEWPNPTWHLVTKSAGACFVLEFYIGECAPPCDESVCSALGVCEEYPPFADAGTLSITGLNADVPASGAQGSHYGVGFDRVPILFNEGAQIQARFSGDVQETMEFNMLGTAGLDDLVPDDGPMVLVMSDEQDLVIQWSPPSVTGTRIQLEILTSNGCHGCPIDTVLWCDAPDTGQLIVPREVIQAFPLGATQSDCVGQDCPLSRMSRVSTDAFMVDAGVAVASVMNSVYFEYSHVEAE